ncbi:MAG: sialidase family protein [Thermoanaerobaculia bacterium]
MIVLRCAFAAALVLLAACGETTTPAPADAPAPQTAIDPLASPAGSGSSAPHLAAAADGTLLLSWIERGGNGTAAVRVARFDGARWNEPVTVVERDDLFVNWADFPSVYPIGNDSLAVHWLQKSGDASYAYDVKIVRSDDGGATWREPFSPHDDGTKTEHGFVSFADRNGTLEAVWLDGRNMTGGDHGGHGGGDMTLRWARIGDEDTVEQDAVLDDRTCECCQTTMTMTSAGPVVAYRDRSTEEVRDIAVVRWDGEGWTEPRVPHPDGWTIAGCPVNGPQLDARGERVALAWFAAPEGEARVQVAFSNDAGATWGAPVRVDGGAPIGRVDVVLLDDDRAAVTWLEGTGDGAEVRSRVVSADGKAAEPLIVATTSSARSAGFPRSAVTGGRVYYAWTDPGTPSRVRLASAPLTP